MDKGKLAFHDYVQLESDPDKVDSSSTSKFGESGQHPIQLDQTPDFGFVRERPETHKVYSAMTSVFCCLPLGLTALYYSIKVSRLYNDGDVRGAHLSSLLSLKFNHSACVLGVVIWICILYVAAMFVISEKLEP